MCSARDLGRSVGDKSAEGSRPVEPIPQLTKELRTDFEPTLFLYDAMPGGVGLAGEIYQHFETLLKQARTLLKTCACESAGCPSCLGPMSRYGGPEKSVALQLADLLLP